MYAHLKGTFYRFLFTLIICGTASYAKQYVIDISHNWCFIVYLPLACWRIMQSHHIKSLCYSVCFLSCVNSIHYTITVRNNSWSPFSHILYVLHTLSISIIMPIHVNHKTYINLCIPTYKPAYFISFATANGHAQFSSLRFMYDVIISPGTSTPFSTNAQTFHRFNMIHPRWKCHQIKRTRLLVIVTHADRSASHNLLKSHWYTII